MSNECIVYQRKDGCRGRGSSTRAVKIDKLAVPGDREVLRR